MEESTQTSQRSGEPGGVDLDRDRTEMEEGASPTDEAPSRAEHETAAQAPSDDTSQDLNADSDLSLDETLERKNLPEAEAFSLPDFNDVPSPRVDPKRVSMLHDVNLKVRIELGRTWMLVEDVLRLGEGSVVELDKLAGDPVDVFVNDRLIARGEVLVLNDSFCVRISEVLTHDPHRVSA